jgi:hypothetical protein
MSNGNDQFQNQIALNNIKTEFLRDHAEKLGLTEARTTIFICRFHPLNYHKTIASISRALHTSEGSVKKHSTQIFGLFNPSEGSRGLKFISIYKKLWDEEFPKWLLDKRGVLSLNSERRKQSSIIDRRQPENLRLRIHTQMEIEFTRVRDNYLDEFWPLPTLKMPTYIGYCEAALSKYLILNPNGSQISPKQALARIVPDVPKHFDDKEFKIRYLIGFIAHEIDNRFTVVTDRRHIQRFLEQQQALRLDTPWLNKQEPPMAA